MTQNEDHKPEITEKLVSFYNSNKLKLFSILGILLVAFVITTFFKINIKKQNSLISEKFIAAELYLASNDKEKSKNLFKEIILSKNKFYSVLALNNILEKNLESDNNKILEYFNLVENTVNSKDQKDLIIFKKALFLIKISKNEEGKTLLKNLIKSNSKIKLLAEEVLAG